MSELSINFMKPKKEDDIETEDPIYSFGTDPAIQKIHELINTEKIDVVAINISTIARNVMDKDKSIDENLFNVIDIIERLSVDIADMFVGTNIFKPYIYFYLLPYHKMIPSEYLRLQGNKSRELLFELVSHYYTYFSSTFKKPLMHLTPKNDVNIVFHVPADEGFRIGLKKLIGFKLIEPSYKTIIKDIAPMRNTHTVALFTHQPLDCHILKKYKSFLVRSHTGEVLDYRDYGEKVFTKPLPFLPALHVVLGDTELIKPYIGIKEKRQLFDIMEKNKWQYMPEYKITQMLYTMYNLSYKID